jgi:WD40 repeat protein
MLELTKAFCPGTREWAFKKVAAWRQDPSPSSRVFVITADKGIGKSCIAAMLTQIQKDFIWGYFFCRHDQLSWRDPKRLVMTWAYQISEKLPEYKRLLEEELQGYTKLSLMELRVQDLFTLLLAGPLHQLSSPPTEPVALLVDALDECEHQGRNELLTFIRCRWGELPHWLRLIATSRPSGGADVVNDILKQLQKFSPLKLAADDELNVQDIEVFARELLKGKLAGGEREEEEAVALLVGKAQGTFLYLQYAQETYLSQHNPQEVSEEENTKLTMERLEEMPEGLSELYGDEFARLESVVAQLTQRDDERQHLKETMQQCLEVVVAAQEPVPLEAMAEVLGCSKALAKKVLGTLTLFLPERGGRVMVWHKSLRDYLTDEDREGERHWVDERAGHRLLAAACVAVVEGKVKGGVVERRRALLEKAVRMYVLTEEVRAKQQELVQDFKTARRYADNVELISRMKAEQQPLEEEHRRAADESQSSWERYCMRHGVRHLRQGQAEAVDAQVRALACDLRYVESKAQAGMAFELAREYSYRGEVSKLGGEANSQGGAGRDGDMYNFYRFALQYGSLLNGRPHLTRQCATNWPDGLLPAEQAKVAERGSVQSCLRLKSKPQALGAQLMALAHGGFPVYSVCFSADGRQVVSGGHDGTAKVWDAASGEEQTCMVHGGGPVRSVCFSADGRQVVSGGDGGTAKVWDAASGEEQTCMVHGGGVVTSVCFSADGRQVVSGGQDGTAKVWDAASGEEQTCMAHGGSRVRSVCFSADGRQVVSGGEDGTAKVWDAASGEEQLCMAHGGGQVLSVCFSADGRQVVSGGHDGTAKVWDAASGEEQTCMAHGGGVVWSVCFSADGRQVVSGGQDGTAKVWDAASGEEQTCMVHVGGVVTSVCFSADGRQVVSGGQDGTAKVWDAATGADVTSSVAIPALEGSSSLHRQRGRNSVRFFGNALQLLCHAAGGDTEAGYIQFAEDIKDAGFSLSGEIFVAFRSRAPMVLEVLTSDAV